MSGCNSRCGCADSYLPAQCDLFDSIVTGQHLPEVLNLTISDQESTLSRVYINFTSDPAVTAPQFTLDSDDDEIEITTATPQTWAFRIMDFTVTLAAGTYFYQLWTIDSTTAKRCWITGTWEISKAL